MTSQPGATDRSPGTAGFSWQPRQDAVLTVCKACRPDDAARWLRQFRSAVLRALRADAIAITLAGCTRLCPCDGRVALVLSLPGAAVGLITR
ncbi:hypothetical protein [Microlunatus parietis]|uniref:Uncharacterized protein n=1 Tax=Microlunatus parietis TaxID=682979 RepID=A0A7Y9I3E1_9ACTN|nr:hypothetical protein [Microlunatus parietis]NYE69458.1 hypothetical protein [Microlunatus parietis]